MRKYIAMCLLVSVTLSLIIYYLTPMAATLVYELYHLVKIEAIYSVYGAMRYLSATFMLWDGRAIVSIVLGLAGGGFLLWRGYRRRNSALSAP